MSGVTNDTKIEQFMVDYDSSCSDSPSAQSSPQLHTDLDATSESSSLLTESSSTPIAAPFMRNKGAKDTCVFGDHLISPNDVECEVFDYVLYELEYKKSPYSLAIALALIVARKLSASATAAHQTQPSNSDYTRPAISSSDLYKESLKHLNEIITEWKANPELAIAAAKDYSFRPYLTAVNAIKNSRRKMEDRNIIIHDLNKLLQFNSPKQYAYYAIFDGHAGVDAASYSAAHLHHNLVKSQAFLDGDINGAFKEAFSVTDLHYLERSAREGKKSGCTALCALLEDKSKLFIAWLGDSQAMLVKDGKPIDVMIPHKPEREDERKRIEDLGGFVVFVDTWRVNGTLAVSRAIGDPEHKPYISSEPDITEIVFDGTEDFLILACDGLWDQITPEEATTLVYEHICENTSDDADEVAESVATCLSKTAKIEGSGDNITTIVIFFKELSALRSTPFEPLSPRTKTASSEYQQNGQFNGFNSAMFQMDSQTNYNQFETNPFDASSNVTQQWSSFSSDNFNTTKIEIDSVDLSSNNSNLSSNINPFADSTQLSQINIENETNISVEPKNVVLETSFESEASGEYYSTIYSTSELKNYQQDDHNQQQFASLSDNTFSINPNFNEIPVTAIDSIDSSNVDTVGEVLFQNDYIDGMTTFKENDEYGDYLVENRENILIPTVETVEADANQAFSSNVDITEEIIDTVCVEEVSNEPESIFTAVSEDNNIATNMDQMSFDSEYQNISQTIDNNESVSDTTLIQQNLDDSSQRFIDTEQPILIPTVTPTEIVEKFDELSLTRNDLYNANEENFENVIINDTKHANDVIEQNVFSEPEPQSILSVDNYENTAVNEKVILETNLDSFNTETIEVPEFSAHREVEVDVESSIHAQDSDVLSERIVFEDSDVLSERTVIAEQSDVLSEQTVIAEQSNVLSERTVIAEQSTKNEDLINEILMPENIVEPQTLAELTDSLIIEVDEKIVEKFTEPEQNYENIDQTDNLIIDDTERELHIPSTDIIISDKPIEPIEDSTIIDLRPNEEINNLSIQQIDDSFSSEQSVDQTNLHSTTDASFNESSLQLINENDLNGDTDVINILEAEVINESKLSDNQTSDANESASKEENLAFVTESLIETIDNTVIDAPPPAIEDNTVIVAQPPAIEEIAKVELISKTTEIETKTIIKTEPSKPTAKTASTSAKASSTSKTVAPSKAKPSSAPTKPSTAASRPKTMATTTSRIAATKTAVNSTAPKQPTAAKPKVETRLSLPRPATTAAPSKPLASRTAPTKAPEVKTANTKPIAPKPAVSANRVPVSKITATSRINTGRTASANTTNASTANPSVNKTTPTSLTRKPVGSTLPSRPKPTAASAGAASKGAVSAAAMNGNSAKPNTSALKSVKSRIDTGRSATTTTTTTTSKTTLTQSHEKKSIVTSRSAVKPIDDKSPQRDNKTTVPAKVTNASRTSVTNNLSPKLNKSNPLNVPKPLKQELEDAVLLSQPRPELLSSLNGSQSTPDAAERAFLLSKSDSLGLSPLNDTNGHTSSYDSPVFDPNINSNGRLSN